MISYLRSTVTMTVLRDVLSDVFKLIGLPLFLCGHASDSPVGVLMDSRSTSKRFFAFAELTLHSVEQ
jgi:hypothetical protein